MIDRLQGMARGVAEVVMEDLRGRKAVLDDIEPDVQDDMLDELQKKIAESLKCPTCDGSGMQSYGSTGPDPEPPAACPECMGTGVHL
jgi:DnaJ-class molecular chaperone